MQLPFSKGLPHSSPCISGAQEGSGVLDLLALAALDEHGLMRTLDAEVAADVEAAARLLASQLQQRCQGYALLPYTFLDSCL